MESVGRTEIALPALQVGRNIWFLVSTGVWAGPPGVKSEGASGGTPQSARRSAPSVNPRTGSAFQGLHHVVNARYGLRVDTRRGTWPLANPGNEPCNLTDETANARVGPGK